MKRLIGYTAVLCLLALTIGCGGAVSSGTVAYVANSTGTGFTVFTVNTNGTLTTASISPQNTPTPGSNDGPKVLVFSPNGLWAYFLDNAGDNIFGYTRAGNGTLVTPINNLPYPVSGASSLAISPNNQFLYVSLPTSQNGELEIFSIDQSDGSLSALSGGPASIGYAISQLVMSSSGTVLYGLAPAQQAVVTFTLSATSGAAVGPNPYSVGSSPSYMILSSNGLFMYVLDKVDTGSVNNVATGQQGQSPNIYAFNTSNCTTTTTGCTPAGVLYRMNGSPFHENADLVTGIFPSVPAGGATSNDTRYLFVVNQGSHNISVFRIGTTSGEPTEILGTLTTVNGIQVSTSSPFAVGNANTTPSFASVAVANNALYVVDTHAGLIYQMGINQNTGQLRPLSPASVSTQSSGSNPTWITIL